ncbi:MAG TPA: hypothetical protein VHZ76_09515 [Gammaproteobacteria bacterium]|jgi:hypothetical protein|nr:hypothetical protein [Gammaproteobacteria bacterium]
MLTREQIYAMLMLRNYKGNIFFGLPNGLIRHISDFGQNPNNNVNSALGHAASRIEVNIVTLVEMVKEHPELLLQAGNVVNRGGIPATRKTLYEFFLGEGDPTSAKRIEFGFAKILNGENERIRQYERYKLHIEALAKQIESKRPSFDLKPLIDLIKKSSPADITAALNKDMKHESLLHDMLIVFRDAIKPKRKIIGMHYEHYTTLQQAFDLLHDEWKELSSNYTNYNKCDLVWRQIIGYLQRSLPAVDQCAFARAFTDEECTLNFKYSAGAFPDISSDDAELSGVGFDEAIFGVGAGGLAAGTGGEDAAARVARGWKTHVEKKIQACRTYVACTQYTNSGLDCWDASKRFN